MNCICYIIVKNIHTCISLVYLLMCSRLCMMDYDEFQKCGEEMLHYVTSYHQNIRMRRAQPDVEPGFMRSLIPEHAPMEPDSWDNVIKDIERVIMPGVG